MTPPASRLSEERLAALKAQHEGFTMSGYASKGQYEDSRTILALIEEREQMARELREAREALGKIAKQMTAAEYEERHGEELGDVVDTEVYETLVLIARKALGGDHG
jgi:hypothetical protein